jgi:hypothetical protein
MLMMMHMPSNRMNAFFNFPAATTVTNPAENISYNNIEKDLIEAINLLNDKYPIVKNSRPKLQKMVDDGTISDKDMNEIIEAKSKIAEKSLALAKKILEKKDFNQDMKDRLVELINRVRVVIYLQIITSEGELETDAGKNKDFLAKATSTPAS